MSVMLRGNKFHYRFKLNGKDYSGVCTGCEVPKNSSPKAIAAIEKKARQIEMECRTKVTQEIAERENAEAEIRKNRTVRALVENYKYELTGGRPIAFGEAFALAAAKPSRREACSRYAEQRRLYWNDFAAFMTANFPDVLDLSSVRRMHCEAYVKFLVDHGRFVKEVSYSAQKRKRIKTISYMCDYKISPKTVKEIVGVCKWVFSRLREDAGLISDPWHDVVLPAQRPVEREVFTPSELRLIRKGIQTNDFCRPLFMIAANSGLTEGDICCMKWSEFDWATGYFRAHRRKTGVRITLPLLPELIGYLQSLPRNGEYVLPDHAEMYLRQPSSVSERVKNFLNGLGIVTTVEVPGRRAVSVKDLHSMRHVFCYRAKRAGIPESIIKKFVGHAVLAMTEHYADHDTDEELRTEIQKLRPLFVGETGDTEDETGVRKKLAELAYTLPLETVKALIARCPEQLTA